MYGNEDQVAFNPKNQIDKLSLFGYQLWGTPEEKKPQNAYNI